MSKKRRNHRRRKSGFRSFVNFLVTLSVIIILGFAVRTFVAVPLTITGDSMADTYDSGDVVVATRFDYLFSTPQRGDVVLCQVQGRDGMYVKRVVGLPGELVEIENGLVSIDGQPLDEPYVAYPSSESMAVQLEADQYMVMGDNRAVSYDSREADMGMLSKADFAGKVRARIWPLGK